MAITLGGNAVDINWMKREDYGQDLYYYSFPTVESFVDIPIPENMRIPFGWKAICIPVGTDYMGPFFRWDSKIKMNKTSYLRFSMALDTREEVWIEVLLGNSGKAIAKFDLRFAPVHQIHSVIIESKYIQEINQQGIQLVMTKGDSPVWILAPKPNLIQHAPGLVPHLMIPGNKGEVIHAFYSRLFSLDSIQQFGWMEGCVLDALDDFSQINGFNIKAEKALKDHLNKFICKNDLVYENPRSEVADNSIYGVECTLPFSVIAKQFPSHPSINLVIKYWERKYMNIKNKELERYTAEGSYTVAFPMMVIGIIKNNSFLKKTSLDQLRLRKIYLRHNGAVYLRYFENGQRTFRNWARGVAWYMLGLARTLSLLKFEERPADLVEELKYVSNWAMSYKMETGLYRCFLDEREVRPDTSGSAGIAAALAIGVNAGILPIKAMESAQKTLDALKAYLTDDGLLTCIAQSNRNGEPLQRDDYRVIFQMGMGLMGQLIAALENYKE